ncbi:unnamed protein product [Schistosoma mattheei]|uniref:Uncharacterized protein n=1 Tax=Schistosoma mattheei TaxID=31246 RepID=A0A3P8H3K9_9TREM|nr:unnamed protein product [Schistosoma mattheei]
MLVQLQMIKSIKRKSTFAQLLEPLGKTRLWLNGIQVRCLFYLPNL